MIKRIIKILFFSLLAVVFIGSSAIAQGKGKGQSGDRPAGWDKGQKEGWQSDVPPGQEEKEKKEKKRKNISGEEQDLEDKQIEKEKKEKQERKQHRKRKQKQGKKSKK